MEEKHAQPRAVSRSAFEHKCETKGEMNDDGAEIRGQGYGR